MATDRVLPLLRDRKLVARVAEEGLRKEMKGEKKVKGEGEV